MYLKLHVSRLGDPSGKRPKLLLWSCHHNVFSVDHSNLLSCILYMAILFGLYYSNHSCLWHPYHIYLWEFLRLVQMPSVHIAGQQRDTNSYPCAGPALQNALLDLEWGKKLSCNTRDNIASIWQDWKFQPTTPGNTFSFSPLVLSILSHGKGRFFFPRYQSLFDVSV